MPIANRVSREILGRLRTGAMVLCLLGWMGFSSALAETHEKIVVLTRQGVTWCELDDSVIRFRLQGEIDDSPQGTDASTANESAVGHTGRLDVRSVRENKLVGQVALSPETVSESITIDQPGIYDIQMRVTRDRGTWQRWLRLDALSDSNATQVVRSWTLVVFPNKTSEVEDHPAQQASAGDMRSMVRLDAATLRQWADSIDPSSIEEDRSLLHWSWRGDAGNLSVPTLKWQKRWNAVQREINSLRALGFQHFVLPIVEPGSETKIESARADNIAAGADSQSVVKADGDSPYRPERMLDASTSENSMLVRMAAAEIVRAGGQVWLQPPRLPCGALADELVPRWNAFWGQGSAAGFVLRWQCDTIRCRQCGFAHGTDALRPIVASLGQQRMVLIEGAADESFSSTDSNSKAVALHEQLQQLRRDDTMPEAENVWVVSDLRREAWPRLSSSMTTASHSAGRTGNGIWLGIRKDDLVDAKGGDAANIQTVEPPQSDSIDDQWLSLWDNIQISREGAADSPVIVDTEMLSTDCGRTAAQLWNRWSGPMKDVPAKVSATSQTNLDGLVTVSRHVPSHSLLLVNRSPWAMKVTLATTESTRWVGKASAEEDTLNWIVPEQTSLGATLEIPPRQMVVCRTEGQLPQQLAWTGYVNDPAKMMPLITEQVTMVVEHVGLLSELNRLPRPSLLGTRPNGARGDAPGSSSSETPMKSSIDRWNPGRVIQASTTLLRSPKPKSRVWALLPPESLLSNGGFEQENLVDQVESTSGRVSIPNWMHAQHPADAVRLDPRAAYRGQRSVRLAGRDASGTQAWLISKNIQSPVAGRIAVSMAVRGLRPNPSPTDEPRVKGMPLQANPASRVPSRGDAWPVGGKPSSAAAASKSSQNDPSTTLVMRVAVEGSLGGQPYRYSKEINVPTDGKWQDTNVVLEWLDVNVAKAEDLRITIDNLSDGTIWVDEVYVTDWFASRSERAEIQSLAYLAVQGLQRNDVKAPAKLLNHFWAKQLLQFAKQRSVDSRRAENAHPAKPAFGGEEVTEASLASDAATALSEVSTAVSGSIARNPLSGKPLASGWTNSWSMPGTIPAAPTAAVQEGGLQTPAQTSSTPAGVDPPMQRPGVTDRIRNWLPQPLRF
ncbi:hypothetical protein [Rhodopirellula halodulae]|uniref:hypothetical protein n=1 Tax=Rhodopirellula halodulae TaxID=2894198 RepID=UPI001E48C51E|nr:hypothetical protein [Rhodopirellula sp. JC737]MCC9655710.1 hypothetical protein [Rhodopirellula sp. JC737]